MDSPHRLRQFARTTAAGRIMPWRRDMIYRCAYRERRIMPKLRSLLLTAAGLLVACTTMAASQADYPNRPVRLIIPFPPGGSNDVVGRMIGDQLGKQLGKQVIIDNRAGAGGV